MPTHTVLPGLDRLISVCQRNSLPLKLPAPLPEAPKEGDLLFGEPLDPQLAAVYRRFGAAEFGPFALYRPGREWMDLIPWNTRLKEHGLVYYSASLIFAQEAGFSLYFGTVPRLADSQGLQPVVYIVAQDADQYAIPLAASVDRFFDLCSRYLELMVASPEYRGNWNPAVTFPWDMIHQIVRDENLIAQVRAGRFDFLANEYEGALRWLQQLRAARG